MDFGTLEIMNGSYVDEAFAEQLRKQGIEEGKMLGTSGIILKLAKKRFGKISSALEQKLKKSDMDMPGRLGGEKCGNGGQGFAFV